MRSAAADSASWSAPSNRATARLDDYTAAIRCITSNGLAIFIVSGPSRGQSDQMAGALFENWK